MSYVPIVDISADPDAVGAELDEICRAAGFFQVTGHGVPGEIAERAWTAATRFFDLPPEDKLSVARPDPDYPYGYIPLAGESLSQSIADAAPPDLKEVFNAGPPVRPGRSFADPGEAWAYSPSLWPAALPELRVAWTAYYDAMRDLGGRLMSLFARGLGLPPGFFAGQTGQAANALRAVNYPARDTAPLPGQLRAGAHTDYGTLTILRQDAVGGLEVLDPSGRWAGVEPVPGAFVINIGDLMARWTNDRWRSTLHRVVDPPDPAAAAARRQSMPYFQNANWSAKISCLPTCLGPGEKPRYEPVLAGPHLMAKFRRSVALSSVTTPAIRGEPTPHGVKAPSPPVDGGEGPFTSLSGLRTHWIRGLMPFQLARPRRAGCHTFALTPARGRTGRPSGAQFPGVTVSASSTARTIRTPADGQRQPPRPRVSAAGLHSRSGRG